MCRVRSSPRKDRRSEKLQQSSPLTRRCAVIVAADAIVKLRDGTCGGFAVDEMVGKYLTIQGENCDLVPSTVGQCSIFADIPVQWKHKAEGLHTVEIRRVTRLNENCPCPHAGAAGTQVHADVRTQLSLACTPFFVEVCVHFGIAGTTSTEWAPRQQPRTSEPSTFGLRTCGRINGWPHWRKSTL